MRSQADFELVTRLVAAGANATEVSKQTGIPRSTVRDWIGRAGDGWSPRERAVWLSPVASAELPASYPYLLGVYLGDGCISEHPRQVYRLRISLDLAYPNIIDEVVSAVQDHVPGNRVACLPRAGRFTGRETPTLVDVSAYSKRWPALFPQHGPGKKHRRPIVLEAWQLEAIERDPQGLLRGLIHSDGCRFINTGTNWRNPRYSFSNLSEDIRSIFMLACDLVGVRHTSAPRTVYVSRKDDVALLDRFIGPKR